MTRKKKMLFEDLAVQGNRWTQDPSGKTQNVRQMTLLDLVKMAEPDKQHPNNVPASQTPIHGSQMFIELIGDLIVQVHQVEKAIQVVESSPLVADTSSSKAELHKMLKKCAFMKKLASSIGDDINNFSVENPRK